MAEATEVGRIIAELKSHGNPKGVEGMQRYGIRSKGMICVPMPVLTRIARRLGTDHDLALKLWRTDVFEARVLAAMIDDPDEVTEDQMDRWARDFDSWAICDGACIHLFRDTRFAYAKAFEWAAREEEFVKRAGFALMASMTVKDKREGDAVFVKFLRVIERNAEDDRVYVKKAVNWALRQIGKRNLRLNAKAIEVSERIGRRDSKSARWIASDALRELRDVKVQRRLRSSA